MLPRTATGSLKRDAPTINKQESSSKKLFFCGNNKKKINSLHIWEVSAQGSNEGLN